MDPKNTLFLFAKYSQLLGGRHKGQLWNETTHFLHFWEFQLKDVGDGSRRSLQKLPYKKSEILCPPSLVVLEKPVWVVQNLRSILRECFIRIAEKPALSGFCRGHHGMSARLCVSGGVAIGRAVATQRRAAGLTGPQVDPLIASFDARFTHVVFRLFDGLDVPEMRAG